MQQYQAIKLLKFRNSFDILKDISLSLWFFIETIYNSSYTNHTSWNLQRMCLIPM
jgi:hypothetical protein